MEKRYKMLQRISSPEDVKKLSLEELQHLAREVRKRIIDVTAKNGGHVAPSLGATDLTIALLKVFDPLIERIVWDVGHQSYAYKILTGRNENFDTLRELNGISGFNNIFESKFDAFGVGHASTSISAAIGITMAKSIQKQKGKTIAIIGDGALTGGMAFEALNYTGHTQKDMIVILNDNNMSISKNVGALQTYLANILVSRSYNALKGKVWDILQHFPSRVKRRLIFSAQTLEENIINTFVPNILFEDIGFKYVGPIDGHDIQRMVTIFQKARDNMTGPVLIHVISQKGKGYEFAESDASKFHGLGPYSIETGKCKSVGTSSYSNVFGAALCDLAKKNDKIVAITAAMTAGTGLTEFAKKFPERFFDVGIAEQHAVTFAGGLAIQGLKPFCAIYSTFLQRAFDQVIHDIALQKLPVVFCLDRAGIVGEDGATHHGVFDLSYLNLIPNLVILAPSSANELQEMLKFASTYQEGPIAIRYPRGSAIICDEQLTPISLGKSVVVHQGEKIALIGIGNSFSVAEDIHDKLVEKGYQAYLIDARFAKPIDLELLENLKKNISLVVTIEENSKIGGYGSCVNDFYALDDVKVLSFGLPDEFIPHGKTDQLKNKINFNSQSIFEEIGPHLP